MMAQIGGAFNWMGRLVLGPKDRTRFSIVALHMYNWWIPMFFFPSCVWLMVSTMLHFSAVEMGCLFNYQLFLMG